LGGPIMVAATGTWNHEGRDYWPQQFAACNGKRQSPININNQDVKLETDVNDLNFPRYDLDWPGVIHNNGHVLQFDPDTTPSGATDVPRVNKGMLEQGAGNYYNYDFLQAHFHWGSHSGQGSEHRIDDVEYPMELHIVHTNTRHGADTSAAVDPEECFQNGAYCGLAVVGILFHVGSENNTVLDPFVEAALEIGAEATYADQNAVSVAKTIKLKDFIDLVAMDNNGPAYYYYKGSLTTPECNEVVNWIVMENTISISEYQLEAFRLLKYADGAPMVDNYRHPQPVNNRVVKRVLRDLKQDPTA
jgi:carbonic anhydrase